MIDYTALLGAAAGIQVARANYDFARDGGAVGYHAIDSEIIPEGSFIVGWAARATSAFTFTDDGSMLIQVGGEDMGAPEKEVGYVKAYWHDGSQIAVTDANLPVIAVVDDHACLSGVGQFWIFYLPT